MCLKQYESLRSGILVVEIVSIKYIPHVALSLLTSLTFNHLGYHRVGIMLREVGQCCHRYESLFLHAITGYFLILITGTKILIHDVAWSVKNLTFEVSMIIVYHISVKRTLLGQSKIVLLNNIVYLRFGYYSHL